MILASGVFACTTDDDCELGYECVEGSCVEIPPVCTLNYPTVLNAGWNMFGFPSCEKMPVVDGLSSIDGNYGDVFTLVMGEWQSYHPLAPPELNTLGLLYPLQGVYIFMYESFALQGAD